MNWLNEWQAISARIQGILDASSFFYRALHLSKEDALSVKKEVLLKSAEKIFVNLKEYLEKFKSTLPHDALISLDDFLNKPKMNESNFF